MFAELARTLMTQRDDAHTRAEAHDAAEAQRTTETPHGRASSEIESHHVAQPMQHSPEPAQTAQPPPD